jgi:hypothetical protein
VKMLSIAVGAGIGAALLGAGPAAAQPSAADVVGKTYADASKLIEKVGGTAIVANKFGSRLSQDQCLVANAWAAPFLRNGQSSRGEVMLALNCNPSSAAG